MSHSKLDRAGIIAEALALLDEQGLADVSLRKLAARLGVTVSSLYWHIRDRDELLALMCETVFRDCLDRTPDAEGWAEWLRGFALALWDKQMALRDCQKLIIVAEIDRATQKELKDDVGARLSARGLVRERADIVQMSVQALVTGWSTLDHNPRSRKAFEVALAALLEGWKDQEAEAGSA